MGVIPECKHCEYREVGCHSKCKYYKDYKKKLEEEHKERDKEREYFDYLRDKSRRC
jgi:hypothetical protein